MGPRIAIYGGSFDPPTVAHQAVIKRLAAKYDEVWVVPAKEHPLKPGLSPIGPRMAMLRATVADASIRNARVKIVPRDEAYTVDMLANIRKERPGVDLTLAVGEDILGETHKWRSWDEIAQTTHIDVQPRAPGSISSSEVRRRLAAREPVEGLVVPAVAAMLGAGTHAAAKRPPGGGWGPVGQRGGFVRRISGRAEYWYPPR